ncbi:hypothetical protein QMA10_13620 [Arthrobacter sp. APC 3897]|uniref:hypothetical protein n=1 Tax=Arthrobacter sp. APC 3897 TaxID=3035204 RepID=UPI0025B5C57A|nr:hypothetical protein [Arthrobacter sp. APC 3897]MDN3482961.1 hypothetical protein [Arthrobacter sp. APC 3897]
MARGPAENITVERATPLERSWFGPALLLAWLSTFALVSWSGGGSSGGGGAEPGAALIYGSGAALTGLAVFLPVRPPALRLRAVIYALPVLLVIILLLLTGPGLSTGLAVAFLPAWALITALYGVRGGLPKGARHVLLYAASAPVAGGTGFAAALALFYLAFAGFPIEVLLVLPLLPLLLLFKTRYRRHRGRTLVEITLSVPVIACSLGLFGLLGRGPGWSPDLAAAAALPVYSTAAVPAAVLLGLGYLARFDTAEYTMTA